MRNDGSTILTAPDLAQRGRSTLAALVLVTLLLTTFGLDKARTSIPSAFDEPDGTPLVVTVGPGGRDLRIAGDLLDGAAERVRALLDVHPGIERVHLTSDGGYVDEGRAIGGLIAERGLVAYVPDRCISACTLAFVRGRERLVTREARLGFHAPFEEDEAGREVQVDGSQEEGDYVAAGVAPDFARAAIHTPSREIWLPDAGRLLAAGVITAVVDDDRFPDSTLDGGVSFAAARAAVLRNVEVLRGFEATAPAVVDDVAAWYLAGYRKGRSEGAAIAGLDTLAAGATRRVLAGADDASLRAAGRVVAEALAIVDEPGACVVLAAPTDLAAAQRTLAKAGRTLSSAADLVAEALKGRVAPGLTLDPLPWRGREANSGVTSGVNVLSFRDGGDRANPDSCGSLRERYASALSAPDTALLRQLIAEPDAAAQRLEAAAQPGGR